MKKYLLRYLLFWLPAAFMSVFFNSTTSLSQVLQWIFAFVMVLGWLINTAAAAYAHPKGTLSFLFCYTGLNILAITSLYSAHYGTTSYQLLSTWGGILSFKPLDVFVNALLDFTIPQEIYVLGFLVACCFIGYVAGLVYRRISPNPYRPKILR